MAPKGKAAPKKLKKGEAEKQDAARLVIEETLTRQAREEDQELARTAVEALLLCKAQEEDVELKAELARRAKAEAERREAAQLLARLEVEQRLTCEAREADEAYEAELEEQRRKQEAADRAALTPALRDGRTAWTRITLTRRWNQISRVLSGWRPLDIRSDELLSALELLAVRVGRCELGELFSLLPTMPPSTVPDRSASTLPGVELRLLHVLLQRGGMSDQALTTEPPQSPPPQRVNFKPDLPRRRPKAPALQAPPSLYVQMSQVVPRGSTRGGTRTLAKEPTCAPPMAVRIAKYNPRYSVAWPPGEAWAADAGPNGTALCYTAAVLRQGTADKERNVRSFQQRPQSAASAPTSVAAAAGTEKSLKRPDHRRPETALPSLLRRPATPLMQKEVAGISVSRIS